MHTTPAGKNSNQTALTKFRESNLPSKGQWKKTPCTASMGAASRLTSLGPGGAAWLSRFSCSKAFCSASSSRLAWALMAWRDLWNIHEHSGLRVPESFHLRNKKNYIASEVYRGI